MKNSPTSDQVAAELARIEAAPVQPIVIRYADYKDKLVEKIPLEDWNRSVSRNAQFRRLLARKDVK